MGSGVLGEGVCACAVLIVVVPKFVRGGVAGACAVTVIGGVRLAGIAVGVSRRGDL